MRDVDVARMRLASRAMVRELGVFDNSCLPGGCSCAQAHAMIELEGAGTLEVAELATVLLLDKSTTSRTVSQLSRRSWVKKARATADARRKPVSLTRRGRVILEKVNTTSDLKVADALSLLGEADRGAAVRGMELYAKALRRSRLRRALTVRGIQRKDDPGIAGVIRDVMTEYGAVGEGYSINDAEVGAMYRAYRGDRSAFFVIVRGDEVLGGAGVGPLAKGPRDTCELRKMYLMPELRGLGLGRTLLEACIEAANRIGYKKCYLETLEHMGQARQLYEASGFKRLKSPMGDTSHCGCDWWYLKKLRGR